MEDNIALSAGKGVLQDANADGALLGTRPIPGTHVGGPSFGADQNSPIVVQSGVARWSFIQPPPSPPQSPQFLVRRSGLLEALELTCRRVETDTTALVDVVGGAVLKKHPWICRPHGPRARSIAFRMLGLRADQVRALQLKWNANASGRILLGVDRTGESAELELARALRGSLVEAWLALDMLTDMESSGGRSQVRLHALQLWFRRYFSISSPQLHTAAGVGAVVDHLPRKSRALVAAMLRCIDGRMRKCARPWIDALCTALDDGSRDEAFRDPQVPPPIPRIL